MEALCQAGNKNPPQIPNPYKVLYPFCVLRDWMGLHILNYSFWNNVSLTQPSNSPKLCSSVCALNFL